VKWILHY